MRVQRIEIATDTTTRIRSFIEPKTRLQRSIIGLIGESEVLSLIFMLLIIGILPNIANLGAEFALNQLFMGRFNISLPNNIRGEVRWGTVRKIDKKINLLLDLLPWRKVNREEKTGYVITVEPATERQREYHLFKSKNGQWTQDAEGTIPLKHETLLALQTAIEAHDQEVALK